MPQRPVKDGKISHGFNEKRQWEGKTIIHGGLDIVSITPNCFIYAAYGGEIAAIGKSATYGFRAWIRNENGLYSIYGHMKELNPVLKEGETISEGAYLGIMGDTGYSHGVHLHYGEHKGINAGSPPVRPIEIESLYI